MNGAVAIVVGDVLLVALSSCVTSWWFYRRVVEIRANYREAAALKDERAERWRAVAIELAGREVDHVGDLFVAVLDRTCFCEVDHDCAPVERWCAPCRARLAIAEAIDVTTTEREYR